MDKLKDNNSKMDIEKFNGLNKSISEIIKELEHIEDVNIITAIKGFKESGKKIAEFYYRYEPIESKT